MTVRETAAGVVIPQFFIQLCRLAFPRGIVSDSKSCSFFG
ncbi:Uncharacterised protein [Ralstonia pickettii]|nr:hypothetical protein HMPREF0989_03356 [Ralstonia sp. 5_2_56FAA]KFL21779.1 hypothetical protein DP23_467 [Ralstonia pickettii]QQK34370.1 hypothetical protein RP6297_00554 [Ralstonia pickettii]SCW74984.1 hypothetical protein SAMN02799637_02322 [Ralstonia sp. UNCCL144]SUE00494.1 Uncharacterised protein [Ralstonia pickettii]